MLTTTYQISAEQYLEMERLSPEKNEYLYENIIPMAGATRQHNQVSINLASMLWIFLRKSIKRVFPSDMRVFNPMNRSYLYPDVVVSDGEPQVSDEYKDNLLNPLVIIEVLSPSTAIHDKTDKFIACRNIPSLKEYVLVSTDVQHIEIYRREEGENWVLETIMGENATFCLSSIDFTCELKEVYEKV